MKITKTKLRQMIREEIEWWGPPRPGYESTADQDTPSENHSEEEERIAKLLMQMKALGYSEEDLLRIWRGEKSAGYETQ